MKYYKITALLLVLICSRISASAQLTVADIFGDHMVLQRNTAVPVWGYASPDSKVNVIFNGQKLSTRTDHFGRWLLKLNPMKEGGPYEMVISAKNGNITFRDIMLGEVWLCSGQSNMEWPLKNAEHGPEEIALSGNERIRQFAVPREVSLKPVEKLPGGQWVAANPSTAGDFTAVGYFFAKEISKKLNVTVGLINTTWGGSQAEGWIDKEALLNLKQLNLTEADFPNSWEDAERIADARLRAALTKNGKPAEYNLQKILNYTAADFNDWPDGNTPGQWDWQQPFWSYRGNAFMMKEVEIYPHLTEQKSTLKLAEHDSNYTLYINGQLASEGEGNTMNINPSTWKPGKNIVLIRIAPQKIPAWFGVGIPGKAEDILIEFENTKIRLGESKWKFFPALDEPYHFAKLQNNIASSIYNAMIYPLVPYGIKGFLWYQGEANASRAKQYQYTFKALINNWRHAWNSELPFLFVQLSSYGSNDYSNPGSDWAELREAQASALALPKTGMVVTTDIGNALDIHPRNKLDVGKRLALNALNNVYNVSVPYRGPVFKSIKFNGDKGVVDFDNVSNGLMIKDNYGYIKGFEIAGADKKFYLAKAELDGVNIVVWNSNVANPVAVRYAWSNAPVDANVFNAEGLPLEPFRTDDWSGVTDNAMYK
jgi:sialate O-acetylesterase